ncbi:MAG TPA: peptidoglycan DD-metalloendopeptidase family protein [Rhodanobacteraceae bacterium]
MHAPFSLRLPPGWLVICAASALGAAGAIAAAPPVATPANASTSAQAATTRAQLAKVRAAIAKLAAAQQATAAQRDSLNAQLATQAAQLGRAANAVQASDAAIAVQTAKLTQLQQQRAALQSALATQRAALADLLRAAYTLDQGSDLSLLLGDDDIAALNRALAYSRYFQHDRVARIKTLLTQAAQLDQVQASIQATTATLTAQRSQREAQITQLQQVRATQQQLLAQADAQLVQQKNKLAALQRDAAALDTLLKQLQNVFADIPAGVGHNIPFAQLHGKLPWPVAGKPQRGAGVLAQGIVIAARPGATVHAVAYGRVAWANFMRGYGVLVIIDHGNGWMSLYGGNEAASVEAGEWVKPGQSIATVARNSEQGGAWFGLRHDGKPVDPESWLASRR